MPNVCGVSRPCFIEHVKPIVPVAMNVYGNRYGEASAVKYTNISF